MDDRHERETLAGAVRRAVERIPYGSVATYGDIAAAAGRPRAARAVGRILQNLPEGSGVPWWRVVNSAGTSSLPQLAGQLQRTLLRQEGVALRGGGRVDLGRFRWQFPEPG